VGEKFDLIDNELHSINIRLNEPKKDSWLKKNVTLVISIVALISSIGFTVYNIRKEIVKDSATSKAKKSEQIVQLALKLTDLAEKNAKLAAENPNVDASQLSVLLNYQRMVYISEIMDLMKDAKEGFPPDIYALIGNELKLNGQFEDALTYYKLEMDNAHTAVSKVVANRDLGGIYGILNSSFHNKDSSDYYWAESIRYGNTFSGDQKFIINGYTYKLRAGDEFYQGRTAFALQMIDSAKSQYQQLHENNMAKFSFLKMLDQMVEFNNKTDIKKLFFFLAGEWNTVPGSRAKAQFHFSQNPNGWYCYFEMYAGRNICCSLSGPIVSSSADHFTFSLQGIKKLDYPTQDGDRMKVSGSIRIFQNGSGCESLKIIFNELNGNKKEFVVCKNE